jgi:membrane-associated protease RseP (regulator of RpoE activity)
MDNTFSTPAELSIDAAPRDTFPWVNVVLFGLTCLSTLIVGAVLMAPFTDRLDESATSFIRDIFRTPSILLSGLPFSIAIMGILFAHEMGHYLTCRYYGIDATLPYFIPAPTLVGTMGAFIKIRSPIHHRPALLEVGIAGPIAGFLLSVPTLIIGLSRSSFITIDPNQAGFGLGEPLIFKLAEILMGKTPPAGMDINLHPIGIAAWFGFLATALNLLPVGQLDGGHIAYALFGRLHRKISHGFLFFLIPLGIFYWQGWLVWATALLFLGLRHPVTVDDSVPLSRRHFWLGWFALLMFILCFTPMPTYIN